MRHLLLLFLLLCASGAANAHRDRILSVQADGTIPEIPAEHGRIAFDAEFSAGAAIVRFTVGGRTTVVPACVARLIPSRGKSDVALTGSWYHDRTVLPNYVKAAFFESGAARKPGQQAAVEILFDMETSETLQVSLRGNRPDAPGSGVYTVSELCQ